MAKQVVIGVDGGTTAVKAAAFNLSGDVLSVARRNIKVEYGVHGEAEQDMYQIWDSVAACLRQVTSEIRDSEIIAVGVTGQGDGCWLLDKNGEPVRKAVTWLDGRATKRITKWKQNGKAAKLFSVTGTAIFPGLCPVLLEEFTENEPVALSDAEYLINCKDWLRFKLTGNIATDYSEASRNYLDINTANGFNTKLAVELGLSHTIRLLPKIMPSWAAAGTVTASAADETGLSEGILVSIGMLDIAVTGAGLGAINNGDTWLILGTTALIAALKENIDKRTSLCSMVLATGYGTQILEFFAPMTGTPNLDWIRETLGLSNVSWEDIEAQARSSPVGSCGVIYLPYASPGGERAPFLDTAASASWIGMSIGTSQANILRSVYEGITYSLNECIQQLNIKGDLVVSGGGFRSDLICEILADVANRTVVRQDTPEAGARGAAVYALVTAGKGDLATCSKMLSTAVNIFKPDTKRSAIYKKSYEVFIACRNAIRPRWSEMRELRELVTNDTEYKEK